MKKTFAVSLFSLGLATLAGCANVSTPMKHSDGRIINCNAMGFGVVGSVAALAMRENCVNNAKEKGFAELDGTTPPPTLKTTPPMDYTGKASITLLDGWVRSAAPSTYTSAIDFAKNPTYGALALLSHIDKKQITDIGIYAETRKLSQMSKLRDATATDISRINIKGHMAYSMDIVGTLPNNGVKYHFRNTIIEIENSLLLFSVWTPEATYSGNIKSQVEVMANELSGL